MTLVVEPLKEKSQFFTEKPTFHIPIQLFHLSILRLMSHNPLKQTVLLITPIYPPKVGGAAVYFHTLASILKRKFNVIILTSYHSHAKVLENANNIKIFRLIPNSRFDFLISPLCTGMTCLLFAILVCIRYNVKVIHSYASGGISLGAGLASLFLRIPIFKDVRNVTSRKSTLMIGKIRRFITCGSIVAQILLSQGVRKEKTMNIPVINSPIVDTIAEQMSKKKVTKSKMTEFIFVGKLSKDKGIDLLLNSFNELAKLSIHSKRIHLTIVGDGDQRKNCEGFIKSNNLSRHITVTGPLDHTSTLLLMAKADILVLPSRSEGYPRTIMEAFKLGKTVVATAVGGIPEMLEYGKNGILVEAEHPESLTSSILMLLHDDKLRRLFAQRAKKYLEKLPNWSDLYRDLIKLYR